ncbi:hypothetical protein CYMTET_24880 [Cymbomonas tetramitiformis]|uniref:Uncharacterized protein n=1 Tax=Cymbomonas tetramitiformis TaxID=36881 RepID=A0AAE0FVR0_9CHLO|nr:hypothetical protein CYMTET_24880 [Cymbomonas tetramitiformis]
MTKDADGDDDGREDRRVKEQAKALPALPAKGCDAKGLKRSSKEEGACGAKRQKRSSKEEGVRGNKAQESKRKVEVASPTYMKRSQKPVLQKPRCKGALQKQPSGTAAHVPAAGSLPREDANKDPLLVDGNRVRVKWPMEDGTWAELDGVVRWLPERAAAGRKRVYEVVFSDGDVRLTRLLGKVVYMVMSSEYMPTFRWTIREERALKRRRHSKEEYASIAVSLGRSVSSITQRFRKINVPDHTPRKKQRGVRTGVKAELCGAVATAMSEVSEPQKAMSQIQTVVEKLPEVSEPQKAMSQIQTVVEKLPEVSEPQKAMSQIQTVVEKLSGLNEVPTTRTIDIGIKDSLPTRTLSHLSSSQTEVAGTHGMRLAATSKLASIYSISKNFDTRVDVGEQPMTGKKGRAAIMDDPKQWDSPTALSILNTYFMDFVERQIAVMGNTKPISKVAYLTAR